MQRTNWRNGKFLALLVAGLFAAGAAQADKPSWAGEKPGKGAEKHKGKEGARDKEYRSGGRAHFEDRHRLVVREYYADRYRAGRCPPGLAKKNNGCLPPGQAKKWVVGRPLPADVVYYSVPAALVVKLGPPPAGHRYVRVAADILLIAVGTSMVVDAVQDLSGM
ncbi:hypothetical protein SAMN05660284_02335 [Formivibrio citricus]|uniref:Nickel/cobalt transporter regulator n=1 Tax=Formivibrio citricus TaxID=83765 RepID=A0A1I5C4P2_9NEIS|nr:hypothetical protein [Formivibrio citricus]SFN82040.1 hypothetical protein SAMN05660284_02335 [Formivibrio citricus]